jgi:hypothetical protein
MGAKIGFWAFIIGFILAIVGGIVSPDNGTIVLVLVVLGALIGLLNITDKEITLFLVATVALIVAGGVFEPIKTLGVGELLDNILSYTATLMAPAAVVAAVKALWSASKPGEA